MAIKDSKPPRRFFSVIGWKLYFCVAVFLLLLLAEDFNASNLVVAWTHSTKHPNRFDVTMRSSSANGWRPKTVFNRGEIAGTRTMAPNRSSSSGLFLSSPQQQARQASHSGDSIGDKNVSVVSQKIFDATLVGDYLVQMSSSEHGTSFVWKLHLIKDIVSALPIESNPANRIVWTDGTEATEALNYALSTASSAETLFEMEPRAEILSFPFTDNSVWKLDSIIKQSAIDETKRSVEKDLLSLLQILQAQWVANLKNTQQKQPSMSNKSSEITIDDDRDLRRKINMDSLDTQDGINRLFQETGLLDADANSNVEWVEMMTGSSQIVGKLPRSFVHKFNILHRGIGAFITKDRPIDLSSISLPRSSSSMPDLYVHRRAAEKRIFPSLYDMFVGGVSLAGEDSELTAQREIAEELGLSKALSTSLLALSDGSPLLTCLVCTAYNRCLVDLFQYTMDTSTSSDESVQWQKEEVAWGDFVDYDVIMASADLSIQRAASKGTWPGPYPPVQSELKGILPENVDASETLMKYDGSWNEWDYVPDGLLVWKAWLDSIEAKRNQHQQQQENNEQLAVSFEIEFNVEEGKSEAVVVELSSMEDVIRQSRSLAARFNSDMNDIQSMLTQMWADANVFPVYDGPSLTLEGIDDNSAKGIVELPSGLILELRPSTIGKDAGLGLFVRKASSDIDDVLQLQGSAFCGYGPCDQITDSLAGLSTYQRQRSFEFMLTDGLESDVWHKGNLLTVGDVIKSTGAKSVRSHLLIETPGEDSKLSLVHAQDGKRCYLVPPAECLDPQSLTIRTIGHMCNDLAGGIQGQTEEEYDASSHRDNLLVLVPRVAVNDDGVLGPDGMPILTLAKSIRVGNVMESMEVGLRYGDSYWKNEFS